MGKAKPAGAVADPVVLISKKTGDWWQDDRRNWCAYCGVAINFSANKPGKPNATRDHVIPKSHKAASVKIPACLPCNQARGAKSLPEFLISAYFEKERKKRRLQAWSLRDLWLVMALAAVEQARRNSEAWPAAPIDGD